MSERNWTEGWDRAQAVFLLSVVAKENATMRYPGSLPPPSAYEFLEQMGVAKDEAHHSLGEILEQAYRLASSGKKDLLTEELETRWPQFPPWTTAEIFGRVDLRDELAQKGFSKYFVSLYYDELYRRAYNESIRQSALDEYMRRHRDDPLGPDEPDRHGMILMRRRL